MGVSKTGVVSFAGTLSDDQPIRTTGLLLEGTNGYNLYPFFINENLAGNVIFQPSGPLAAQGKIQWMLDAGKSKYFPLGFDESLDVQAVPYVAPGRGGTVLLPAMGTVTLAGGGLAASLPISVMLTAADKIVVTLPNTYKLRMSIDARNGTFVGSFVAPGATRATPIHGDFYQAVGVAFGSFLGPVSAGTSGIGTVTLN